MYRGRRSDKARKIHQRRQGRGDDARREKIGGRVRRSGNIRDDARRQ